MKAKDIKTLKKYGFLELITEENLPSKITKWRDDFTDAEIDSFSNLWIKDDDIKRDNLVVSDSHVLYWHEGILVYHVGHSRRGQHYYLLADKATLEISIIASKGDGDGSSVLLPNILVTMIKNGDLTI